MTLLVGVNLLNSILNSQYFYKLGLVGLRMRSALTSALYRKALLLGPASRKDLTGAYMVFCLSCTFSGIISVNVVMQCTLLEANHS